ncbi:unnamed protein product [Umbelopsis sp. WA50703]
MPQYPAGEIPPEMSHRTVRSVPRKKSSSSLLKRTTSWSTDRKRDKADKVTSPLVRSETVSVTSSPTSMTRSPSSPLANSISVTNVSTVASTTGQRQVDLTRFGDANFNPETYMRESVADANEEQLRAFYRSLTDAKGLVGSDLQRNVYRNYTEFVVISKEISNLDGDMLLLRDFIKELRTISASFKDEVDPMAGMINDTTPISESITQRRKPTPMATSDMQTIYRVQLSALWQSIEGAQRLIPFIPDRHVLREFPNVAELHPKTMQARQAAQFILLNDCVLVATRKKRTMSYKVKLVADRCWPLGEIQVQDIKNTPEVLNTIKVVHFQEVYFFRCERLEDKNAMLIAIQRATAELMDNTKQNEAEASRGVSEPLLQMQSQVETRTKKSRPDRDPAKQSPQLSSADMKWLSELPDELEVFIALREFEEAVAYIEKARAIIPSFSADANKLEGIKEEIDVFVEKLSKAIGRDLSNSLLTKVQFQRNINWLLRLGLGESGREMFLATRAAVIKKRIRQLTFEGDVTTYINELSLIVFTLIRNTCEWYRDSFKDNRMASGFVTWVKEQISIYAQIFNKQVFGQNSFNLRVIADCLRSTSDQCTLLRKVGLDLKFLLDDLFAEEIKALIVGYEERCIGKLDKIIKEDRFLVVSSQSLGTDVKVTASVVSFYNILIKFVNEACLLVKLPLYTTMITSISNITEQYLRRMVMESQAREMAKDQRYAAMMNVAFVLDNVVPRISSQLNRHFDRPIPELDTLRATMRAAEVIFFINFWNSRRILQRASDPIHISKSERAALFWNCVHTIDDVKEWFCGWFYIEDGNNTRPTFEQIKLGNVQTWFAWAFWSKPLHQVKSKPSWANELDWMVSTAESHFGVTFEEGISPNVKCIRLNLDPVNAIHRPFIFYTIIYLATQVVHLVLRYHGFSRCNLPYSVSWGSIFGFDPLSMWKSIWHDATDTLSKKVVYWHRPSSAKNANQTPIVFIHGIGGMLFYTNFIGRLVALDRPMFCVELPYVSMHQIDTVPTTSETVSEISQMLSEHGYSKAVFVGHSLGTAVSSWMMQQSPKRVAGVVMVDPIVFLLHFHSIAYNFVHRAPKRLMEHVVYYFASRELHISHYISRHFQWFQTAHFVQPASSSRPPSPSSRRYAKAASPAMSIFLSENDNLVDSTRVHKYLLENGVDSQIMPNIDHAGFLLKPSWLTKIVDQVSILCATSDIALDTGYRTCI